MKPRATFGYEQADYQLKETFLTQHSRLETLNIEFRRLDTAYRRSRTKSVQQIRKMFDCRDQRIQAATITVITAVSYLELVIYLHACNVFDYEFYEKYMDRLPLPAKWMVVPRLARGIILTPASPEITRLTELVQARNAIVHPKVSWMDDGLPSSAVNKDIDRFNKVAKASRRTVELLLQLLPSTDENSKLPKA
jgi:hypothetical protein